MSATAKLASKLVRSATKPTSVGKRRSKRKKAPTVLSTEEVLKRLKAREPEPKSTPKSTGKGRPKSKAREVEGARLDPETGGSVDVSRSIDKARQGGTEKITVGARSGTPGIVEASTSQATKDRAKRIAQLETKEEKGTITAKEQRELDKLIAKDEADTSRAAKAAAKTRREKRLQASRKDNRNPRDTMMQTGEIMEGYKPTQQEIQLAVQNSKARKLSSAARERFALLERRLTNAPQTKGLSREARKEKINQNPKGMNVRSEERKFGGKVIKRKKGKKIGRGCGVAMRGGGAVMKS
tara:strand:+ start:150 stop:1040 length:891 start_codon:yes stop_codon:yes gene_type:complete